MAQPQPKYQQGSVSRGINAILLGAPGSGKGTQVRIKKMNKNFCQLTAKFIQRMIAQRIE